jgi:hypothetical protein
MRRTERRLTHTFILWLFPYADNSWPDTPRFLHQCDIGADETRNLADKKSRQIIPKVTPENKISPA